MFDQSFNTSDHLENSVLVHCTLKSIHCYSCKCIISHPISSFPYCVAVSFTSRIAGVKRSAHIEHHPQKLCRVDTGSQHSGHATPAVPWNQQHIPSPTIPFHQGHWHYAPTPLASFCGTPSLSAFNQGASPSSSHHFSTSRHPYQGYHTMTLLAPSYRHQHSPPSTIHNTISVFSYSIPSDY